MSLSDTIQNSHQQEVAAQLAPGLYLVATPVGNLEDITLRALRVLRGADRIACEDTRHTQKLLNHFGIATPTVSYHMHNESSRSAELVRELLEGARIAVVSDAGTPAIADPGGLLTAAAIEAGVSVYPIPGANAAILALTASGLLGTAEASGQFQFLGFLPAKQGQRRTALEQLRSSAATSNAVQVAYEAPHRIQESLADLEAVFGPTQPIVVARELTKVHEEFLRGPVTKIRESLASRDAIRGEFVILFRPVPLTEETTGSFTIAQEVAHRMTTEGVDEKEALKRVARARGLGKSEAYRELQRSRGR